MRWLSLNKPFSGIVLICCFSQVVYCQKQWIDEKKSSIEFEITHLGVLVINGSFKNFEGTLEVTGVQATVSGRIKSGSINTSNNERDEAVKGKGFLNVEAYPEITFFATGTASGDSLNVTGPMKLRGATHAADLKCKYVSDRQLACKVSIKRSDFKLDFGSMDALVGDNVMVKLNLFIEIAR